MWCLTVLLSRVSSSCAAAPPLPWQARIKQTSITSIFSAAPAALASEAADAADATKDGGLSTAAVTAKSQSKALRPQAGASNKAKKAHVGEAGPRQASRQDHDASLESRLDDLSSLAFRGRHVAAFEKGSAARPSLMSFFTRLDSTKSKTCDATSEAASRRAQEPEASERLQPAPLLETQDLRPGAHAAGNVEPPGKRVIGDESADGERLSDSGPAASASASAKMSKGAAVVEWGKILHMKKQKSAVCAVAPPKYLSQKEQKAFLATAAEAPLCPGHREPAIQRIVQKDGPNRGRRFWVRMSQPCIPQPVYQNLYSTMQHESALYPV